MTASTPRDPLDEIVDATRQIVRLEAERDARIAEVREKFEEEIRKAKEIVRNLLRAEGHLDIAMGGDGHDGEVALPEADPAIPGDGLNTLIVQTLRSVGQRDLAQLTRMVTGKADPAERRRISARMSFLKKNSLVEDVSRGVWRAAEAPASTADHGETSSAPEGDEPNANPEADPNQ